MDAVKIKDKMFRISIPESEIKQRVKAVAERINHDLAGKNPLFLAVLNGAFVFAADLMREITIPCEISFVKLASYQGTVSTGTITEVMGINEDLTDRVIVIVEDIVDTGLTMKRMMESLGTRRPAEIHICSLLLKPEKLQGATQRGIRGDGNPQRIHRGLRLGLRPAGTQPEGYLYGSELLSFQVYERI